MAMKYRVVKSDSGEVVAAYPIAEGDVQVEFQLEKGERVVELDIPEEAAGDRDRFLRACSSGE
jgi:hypothetical protein